MDFLPVDINIEIIIYLSIDDIQNVSFLNVKFNTITNSENFWKRKTLKDFGNLVDFSRLYIGNWKEVYLNFGNVLTFGADGDGQLGLNSTKNVYEPTKVKGIKAKKAFVNSTCSNTFVVDFDNNVFSCGGGIGIGSVRSNEDRHIFMKVPNVKAKEISQGFFHTSFIDLDNNLWLCGFGLFAIHEEPADYTPVKVPNMKVKQTHSTMFNKVIDMDDMVRLTGNVGKEYDRTFNIKAKSICSYRLETRSDSWECVDIIDFEGNIWMLDNWTDKYFINSNFHTKAREMIKVGNLISTFILDTEDNVWVLGNNSHGQLGIGHCREVDVYTKIPNIKARKIAAGGRHTLILDTEYNVWVSGDNVYGQLGLGNNENIHGFIKLEGIKAIDIAAGGRHSVIIQNFNGYPLKLFINLQFL